MLNRKTDGPGASRHLTRRRFMSIAAGGAVGGALIATGRTGFGSSERITVPAPSAVANVLPQDIAVPGASASINAATTSQLAQVTGQVVVGDVLDHVLETDEWEGDYGWVTFRLHEGRVGGEPVYFIRTDASDADFASQEGLVYVPLMANAAEADVGLSALWLFDGGTDDQTPVLGSAPHRDDFSPAFRVYYVTFNGAQQRLDSADAIRAAQRDGLINVERTDIIVNYPVVKWPGGEMPVDTELTEYLGGGQLTEPVNVDGGTVTFKLHPCYPATRYIVTDATMMGSMMMNIADAPGAAPLTAAGATDDILVFGNGVEGSGPMGFQKSVVRNNVGDPEWSPYWDHYTFLWADDVEPEVIRSHSALQEREDMGDLQRFSGTPDTHPTLFMVNCPVPVVAPVD